MRELKFRAWDGKNMQQVESVRWAYIETIVTGEGTVYLPEKLENNFEVELCNGNTLMTAPNGDMGLMQYTGLTDKSGVEIYEGDIIQIYQNSGNKKAQVTVVEWDGRTCQYRGIYPTISNLCQHEVIGNVYENPELMK